MNANPITSPTNASVRNLFNGRSGSGRKGDLPLFAICFGFFLVLLDTTGLNMATAAAGREFGGSMTWLQWVVNSYTLVFVSLLLAMGALGDRYGWGSAGASRRLLAR
jgi:MFS family permease